MHFIIVFSQLLAWICLLSSNFEPLLAYWLYFVMTLKKLKLFYIKLWDDKVTSGIINFIKHLLTIVWLAVLN